ncbi:MAG: DNA-deoxyinosine glycosylase [Stomatobaculum sp.]
MTKRDTDRDTNGNSEQAGAETPAVFDAAAVRRQYHEFPPVYDQNSRILILGSFPSVKSRAQAFYYGHPQNRFWKVLATVAGEQISDDTEARRRFLLRRGIALWDVLESCEIHGSSDASIRAAEPVEIERITGACSIERICVNGSTAKKYYDRYLRRRTGREAVLLPSTSPANAAWSLARLTEAWRAALGDCI